MFSIPNPLHPAVVHFPIALIMVGAFLSVLAVIFRRWALPAALVLALGAAGAVVAVKTGEDADHDAGRISAQAQEVLKKHAQAAELTRNLSLAAAGLAVVALFLGKIPLLRRILAGLVAIVALIAVWSVAETGHYGGELVYRNGVGVKLPTQPTPSRNHE